MIHHLFFIFTSYLEDLIPQRQKPGINCSGYFVEVDFEFKSKGKRTYLEGSSETTTSKNGKKDVRLPIHNNPQVCIVNNLRMAMVLEM